MKLITLILLGIMISCSFQRQPLLKDKDIFEKVFYIKKKQNVDEMQLIFGAPKDITQHESDPGTDNYFFEKNSENPSINVFVDRNSKKIISFAIVFWAQIDGYDYMRERFKGHEWIETPLPSKAVHHPEDLNRVEIPDLGIIFDYDNQDPLRRPMWIFVK